MARVLSRPSAQLKRLCRIAASRSEMPSKGPPRVKSATRAALLALALGGVPASAQTADPAGEQPGAPRNIVPPQIVVPAPLDVVPLPSGNAQPGAAPATDSAPPAQPMPDAMPEPMTFEN